MIDVLVVDDDFMVASIHTRFVERTDGYRVVGAYAPAPTPWRQSPSSGLASSCSTCTCPTSVAWRSCGGCAPAGSPPTSSSSPQRAKPTACAAPCTAGPRTYLVKPFEYDDLRVRLEQLRATRQALQTTEVTDQGTIDALFGSVEVRSATGSMPKGLSTETGELVLAALSGQQQVSAAECAASVGLSRVTARRYLEHFVTVGAATVRLRYGRTGRPERRYSAL